MCVSRVVFQNAFPYFYNIIHTKRFQLLKFLKSGACLKCNHSNACDSLPPPPPTKDLRGCTSDMVTIVSMQNKECVVKE